MALTRNCEECDEPLSKEHHFVTTVKEDHNPKDPHIRAEPINVETYRCPECGHCPVDEIGE